VDKNLFDPFDILGYLNNFERQKANVKKVSVKIFGTLHVKK